MTQPIIFPDPISSLAQISGATLLYFDDPLLMGLPAGIIPPVAAESLRMLKLVEDRKPPWAPTLQFVLQQGLEQTQGTNAVLGHLASVRESTVTAAYLSYPAGHETFALARQAATRITEKLPNATSYITTQTAANDLQRHIFLESFLERGRDINALYDYCVQLFTDNSLEHLLISAYLIRIAAFEGVTSTPGVLLLNPRVVELLGAAVPATSERVPTQANDVVAWQIFRQILSPRLDPLTDDRIALIREIRTARNSERAAFVDRCREIASKILAQRGPIDVNELRKYVQSRVEPEIASLLGLDKKVFQTIATEIFSDKETWGGLAASIAGFLSGTPLLSAIGAIAALSSMGAAAYKTRMSTKARIEESDLRLLYFINRQT